MVPSSRPQDTAAADATVSECLEENPVRREWLSGPAQGAPGNEYLGSSWEQGWDHLQVTSLLWGQPQRKGNEETGH